MTATRVQAPYVAAAARPLVRTEEEPRWTLLLGAVAVYLLAAVGRVHQLIPAVGLARPILLSAALALGCIALDGRAVNRLRAAIRRPNVRWLLLLLVWGALSIPMALYRRAALDTVLDLAKSVAMLVAVATAVQYAADVRRLAITMFAAMAMFAIIVLQRFDTSQRLGRLVYYDANEFALLVVVMIPFGVHVLWTTRHWTVRIAVAAAMGAAFIVFVASGSRGGMLAMGATLAVVLLRFRAIPVRWRLATLTVAVASFAVMASDAFWRRLDSVVETEDDYNITSPTGRLHVWKRGFGYMIDNPIVGVGAGNFATAEGTLSWYAARLRERNMGIKWSAAHNSFVQVGAELGVPGLVFFVAAIFQAFRTLVRVQRIAPTASAEERELAALASATMAGLVGFVVGGSFLSLAYHDMLFALLALTAGIAMVARTRVSVPYHLRGAPA